MNTPFTLAAPSGRGGVSKPAAPQPKFDQHCVVCGSPFVVYGAGRARLFHTCGSPECVLHFARHQMPDLPLSCPCPQRPYPHDVTVHALVRRESFAPQKRFQWPWSLALSERVEPSTERKAA